MFSSRQSRRRNSWETPWADEPGWAAELLAVSKAGRARPEHPCRHLEVHQRAESAGGGSGMPGETDWGTAERKTAEVLHRYRVVEPGLERSLPIRLLVDLLQRACPRYLLKRCLRLLPKRTDR